MIRSLRGKVIGKTPPTLVVEVNGLGYGLFAPLEVFDKLKLNEEAFLQVYHHLAEGKEDLYGFTDINQRDFFELLLTVSGVGPKSALSVVSSNSVDVLQSSIAEGRAEVFANASGIGKKTAERIIVDLKSKIGMRPGLASGYGDTFEALRALGYTPGEVKDALTGLPTDIKDTQEQIKLALQALARK